MKRPRAFSLIEVVIALGIVSFAVVAIFGLMSNGLLGGRESANDLAVGLMTQTISANLQMAGYQGVLTNNAYSGNPGAGFFFDIDGNLALNSTGGPSATAASNSYYACAVGRRMMSTLPTTNIMFLRMVFSWPLQAPAANRQQRVVLTSLGNND